MVDKYNRTYYIKDVRLVRPMVFLEKGGQGRMMAIQQATTLEINKCEMAFPTPNPVSLFISISRKEFDRARSLYKDFIQPNLNQDRTFKVEDNDLPKLFDYFEFIQTSIITIYSAIEAFSNVAIPNDYTLEKLNNKGEQQTLNKDDIERWISTSEKIGDLVPKILKIESPKSLNIWSMFKKLEKMRNDIIHQKYSPQKPTDIESKYLGKFLSEEIFDWIKSGFSIIEYFCQKEVSHTFFPILAQQYPLVPIEVENWDVMSIEWVPFKNK